MSWRISHCHNSPVQDEQPAAPPPRAAEEPDTAVDTQIAVPTQSPKKRGRPRKHALPPNTESTAMVPATEPSSSPERRRKLVTPVSSPHSHPHAVSSQRRRDSQSHQSTQSVRQGKCGCGFKGDVEAHLDQLGPLDIKTKGLKSLLAGLGFVLRDVKMKTLSRKTNSIDCHSVIFNIGQRASQGASRGLWREDCRERQGVQ
jgi:hypothetical protein